MHDNQFERMPNQGHDISPMGPKTLNPEDRLYSLDETSEFLGICPSNFRKVRRDPRFPAPVTIGGKKKYTLEQRDAIKRKLHILSGFNG